MLKNKCILFAFVLTFLGQVPTYSCESIEEALAVTKGMWGYFLRVQQGLKELEQKEDKRKPCFFTSVFKERTEKHSEKVIQKELVFMSYKVGEKAYQWQDFYVKLKKLEEILDKKKTADTLRERVDHANSLYIMVYNYIYDLVVDRGNYSEGVKRGNPAKPFDQYRLDLTLQDLEQCRAFAVVVSNSLLVS